MNSSDIIFYGGCSLCTANNVFYCMTNPDESSDYKFICEQCIGSRELKIFKGVGSAKKVATFFTDPNTFFFLMSGVSD